MDGRARCAYVLRQYVAQGALDASARRNCPILDIFFKLSSDPRNVLQLVFLSLSLKLLLVMV